MVIAVYHQLASDVMGRHSSFRVFRNCSVYDSVKVFRRRLLCAADSNQRLLTNVRILSFLNNQVDPSPGNVRPI